MQYKSQEQKEALEKQGKFLQQFNQKNKLFKTEEDKQKVIDLYNSGLSCNQIAKKFNCSKFPILNVLKGLPKRSSGEYDQHFSKTQGYGETHHSWKGGFKSVYDRFRDLKDYWVWRNSVLERDMNCCTQCSSTEKLHIHHIKTLKNLILDYCKLHNKEISELTVEDLKNEFFYELDNGLTLCEDCHKRWHKQYGR